MVFLDPCLLKDETMKFLAIIVLAVTAMVFCGWLTFGQGDGTTSVTVDTNEVKSDTKAAVEKGKELIDAVVEEGRDLIGEDQNDDTEAVDEPAPSDSGSVAK